MWTKESRRCLSILNAIQTVQKPTMFQHATHTHTYMHTTYFHSHSTQLTHRDSLAMIPFNFSNEIYGDIQTEQQKKITLNAHSFTR